MADRNLIVGDVVIVGRASGVNPANAIAVVVEVYELEGRPGSMLLFEHGAADGFSPADCELFEVRYLGHEPRLAGYQFVSMIRLSRDWRAGLFSTIWSWRKAEQRG